MARQEKCANISECLHNITSVTSNITLPFTPLAIGLNFGSSDSIGSLKGQAEMTLNRMSSDPNNAANSLDLILMRLSWTKHSTGMSRILQSCLYGGAVISL